MRYNDDFLDRLEARREAREEASILRAEEKKENPEIPMTTSEIISDSRDRTIGSLYYQNNLMRAVNESDKDLFSRLDIIDLLHKASTLTENEIKQWEARQLQRYSSNAA